MALSNPFDPPPNTPLVGNASVWAQWARWFWTLWKRVQAGSLGGTVTSVAVSAPVEFSVTGSPITTSGTIAISKATETANTVWAGPTSGAAAQPAFRALVPADIPSAAPLTIGTTPIVSGTVSRLLYEGASNLLQESANLTFDGTTLTASAVTSDAITLSTGTSNRIALIGIGGALTDSSLLTWATGSALASAKLTLSSSNAAQISATTTGASKSAFTFIEAQGTGDAFSVWTVSLNGKFWYAGIDNSASDQFAIGYATNGFPGLADFITISTAGDVTLSGTLGVTGTLSANTIAVASGTTATVYNTAATTVNAFGAASTALNIGNSGGANTISGATTLSQAVTFGSTARLKGFTVATLPAAGTAGRMAYVTDALAPTYLGAVVGGGAVVTPVFDDGTNWVAM